MTHDLIGRQFGRIKVVERAPNNKWRETTWRCVCACGTQTTVSASHLVKGATRSCGCGERGGRNPRRITAFGQTKTLAAWAKEKRINKETLRSRISKAGWRAEDALTEPVHPYRIRAGDR